MQIPIALNNFKTRLTTLSKRTKQRLIAIGAVSIVACGGSGTFWMTTVQPLISMFKDDQRATAFQNMNRVLDSAPLTRSSSPRPLVEDLKAVPETFEYQGNKWTLDGLARTTNTTGLIVMHNGDIAFERYWQGQTKETQHVSWSMAKAMVSMMIGAALADGSIKSLDDTVATYIPEFKDAAYGSATIRQLLQMSTGIKFSEHYDDPKSDINRFFLNLLIMHRSIGEFIHDLPAKRPHGQIMDYKSMDTQVAAMVVEHATGKPLDRYLHDRIWEPMGAERDAYWSLDKRNSALAFCCLNATLRDFAKIGLVYLNDGRLNGKQILPAEWVKASHTPDVQIGRSPDNKYVWHFKNYWWIPAYDDGDGDYLSEGVWGQYIYVNPKHNVVIVKVGGGAGPEDYEQESLAMFRSLARSFS